MTPEVKTDAARTRCDRPFPWPCANCLKDEVYPVTMPYTTEVKHDGRTYKLTIPALTIPKCRACGELVFSNSVDDQIVQALRAEARLLTPQQIREGREALGLQSKELAERLGVAKETLSRWETGMMIQSRAMDNLLRAYFAVPEVRAVLRGAEQEAAMGTLAVLQREAGRPATDDHAIRNGGHAMTKNQFRDAVRSLLAQSVAKASPDDKFGVIRQCIIEAQEQAGFDEGNKGKPWTDEELRVVLKHAPTKENCILLARAFRRGYGAIEQIFRWAAAADVDVKAKRQSDVFVQQIRRVARQIGWRAVG
jgi:putative zinc finger/helix-turn-helix YgiT family protein